MSRGVKAVLAYAVQTDVAVKPLTGWKSFPRKSDSLNHKVEMTESETINDSRIKTAGLVTSASAEGDVECEFIKGTYDDLIAAAAGNVWAGDKVSFAGDVATMFALEKQHKDIDSGLYHYWGGMRVNTFKLDIPETGFIGLTFGFMGSGYENGSTAYSVTPTVSPTAPMAASITVGDININGSTMQNIACVTQFSFEANNNIERQNCLGSGLYGAKLLEMMADLSGSLTMAYGKKAQEILNNQMTGAVVSIEALINFSDGSSYTLTIPKAQLAGDIPSGGRDKLEASLSYTVVADTIADAPYITRTLKP
mgnify:CR=1 FL=1